MLKKCQVKNVPAAVAAVAAAAAADVAVEVAAALLPLDGGVVCCPLEDRFLPFRPTGFRFSFFCGAVKRRGRHVVILIHVQCSFTKLGMGSAFTFCSDVGLMMGNMAAYLSSIIPENLPLIGRQSINVECAVGGTVNK